jgi:hypothetical protein
VGVLLLVRLNIVGWVVVPKLKLELLVLAVKEGICGLAVESIVLFSGVDPNNPPKDGFALNEMSNGLMPMFPKGLGVTFIVASKALTAGAAKIAEVGVGTGAGVGVVSNGLKLNCNEGVSVLLSSLVVSGILKIDPNFSGASDFALSDGLTISLCLAPKRDEPNLIGSLLELLMPNLMPDKLVAFTFSGKIRVGCDGNECFLVNKLKGSEEDGTNEDDRDDGLSL